MGWLLVFLEPITIAHKLTSPFSKDLSPTKFLTKSKKLFDVTSSYREILNLVFCRTKGKVFFTPSKKMKISIVIFMLSLFLQNSVQALVVDTGCSTCSIDPNTHQQVPLNIIFRGLDKSTTPGWLVEQQKLDDYSVSRNITLFLNRMDPDRLRGIWPTILSSGIIDITSWTSVGEFKDYAYDLTNISIANNWTALFPKRLLELHSVSGRLLGLPDRYGFWGIWYSKSKFSELGITSPHLARICCRVCNVQTGGHCSARYRTRGSLVSRSMDGAYWFEPGRHGLVGKSTNRRNSFRR